MADASLGDDNVAVPPVDNQAQLVPPSATITPSDANANVVTEAATAHHQEDLYSPVPASTLEVETTTISQAPPPPSPPKAKPGPRVCAVCMKEVGKYKCPRCAIAYCSVACSKIHQENHPPTEPSAQTKQQQQQQQPAPEPTASDNDPYSVLLDHHAEFNRLFTKYPNLQTELLRIEDVTLPPSEGSPFGGGSGLQLNIPGRQPPRVWSRDMGLRKGVAALRKARTDPGDKGDGLREFCELVLYLLDKEKTINSKDVTILAKEEMLAEEAKVIERLLKEDEEKKTWDR
ncbi:hypothetical protein B0T17DRAFT_499167 [Bombardia bombarda]|uniref:HIT-type domain-containing protein n=1 Tax=Bombardia bombarda TaxID=252184 RepID=A0AA39WD35_9PEZI|nr:hypothetical protein B0T17DRAFT_499167 [Bombardia bombarda]